MTSTGLSNPVLLNPGPFILYSPSDGVWDREEIEAIYGVHHIYSKKKSKVCTLCVASYLAHPASTSHAGRCGPRSESRSHC